VIASPGSVEAQRAFILGDPKPEADVGNLARPITDVVSSPHSKRGMTVSGQEYAFARLQLDGSIAPRPDLPFGQKPHVGYIADLA
jgi:hypothetical protein